MVKLRFVEVNLIFLILLQNIGCEYLLNHNVVTSTHNICFEQKLNKSFLLKGMFARFVIFLYIHFENEKNIKIYFEGERIL